jgi:excisionase family DNA binding protein
MTDFISAKNSSTLLPEYFSLSGLAVYASVSRNTLKKWLRDSNMPHYRIGRCIRVRKSEFDVWVRQFRNGTSKPDLDTLWNQVMKEVQK